MYARTGAGPPPTVTLPKNAGGEAGIVSSWGTPTRPTAPPGRAMLMAVSVDTPWPTHSSTEWAPKPPVSPRTRSTASSPLSLTTSVAPNSLASAIRSSWRPMMMICSAPRRLTAITPHRPTAPSPTTATLLPGPTFAAGRQNRPPGGGGAAHRLGLRPVVARVAEEPDVDARRREPLAAELAGAVGVGERHDNQVALLDLRDLRSDVLDDAYGLVAHRLAGLARLHRVVRPEVAAADAGAGDAD